ncbi:polymeric immunoglobulin receptor-like, partial [Clarias magur]
CRLNQQTVSVTGYVGQSVLLPCSCYRLQAKPHSLRWMFFKGSDGKEIFPKDQTHRYTDRVQLFNDHHAGNLSLLISHLTVEDGGYYSCRINNATDANVKLIVRDAPTRPSASTPVIIPAPPNPTPGGAPPDAKPPTVINDKTPAQSDTSSEKNTHTTPDPHKTTIIICTAAGVLLLLILGGVMYWKHRGQRQRPTDISDGQTGQRRQQEGKNDSDVLYTVINPPCNKVEEK